MTHADKFIGNIFERPMDWFGISDETVQIVGMSSTKLFDSDMRISGEDRLCVYDDFMKYKENERERGITSNVRKYRKSPYKYKNLTGIKTDFSRVTYFQSDLLDNAVSIGENFRPDIDDGFIHNLEVWIDSNIVDTYMGSRKHYKHLDNGGYGHLDKDNNYRFFQVSNKVENDGILVSNYFYWLSIPFGVCYGMEYNYVGLALKPNSITGVLEDWFTSTNGKTCYMRLVEYSDATHKAHMDIIDPDSGNVIQANVEYPNMIGTMPNTADGNIIVINTIFDAHGKLGGGGVRISTIIIDGEINTQNVYDTLAGCFYNDMFPIIHLINNRKLITKSTDAVLVEQTRRKMKYLYGMDMNDFIEKALDKDTVQDTKVKDSLEDCVSATVGFFLNLNDKDDYISTILLYEMIDRAYDSLKIDNGNGTYRIGISFHDFGNIIFDIKIDEMNKTEGKHGVLTDNKKYEREDTCYGLFVIYLRKQITNNTYDEYYITNITIRFIIVDEKRIDYKYKEKKMDCNYDSNPIVPLIPISYEAYRKLPSKYKRIFITHFTRLIMSTIHDKHLHYWQTNEFGDFIKVVSVIVTVVVSVVTDGAGTILVEETFQNLIVGLVAYGGVNLVFALTDNKIIRAIAVIVSIYYSGKALGENSATMTSSTMALKAIEATNTYLTLQLRYDAKEFEHDVKEFYQNYRDKLKELEDKNNDVDKSYADRSLEFMKDYNGFAVTLPMVEGYDEFMNRTMGYKNNKDRC